MSQRGRLSPEELVREVQAGRIETIVTVIPDLYGRLVGKRIHAPFFLDSIAGHGMHDTLVVLRHLHLRAHFEYRSGRLWLRLAVEFVVADFDLLDAHARIQTVVALAALLETFDFVAEMIEQQRWPDDALRPPGPAEEQGPPAGQPAAN